MGKKPAGERPVFSASRVGSYLVCPRAYYFKYTLGLTTDEIGWSALVGQAYHQVISDWHSLRREADLEQLELDFVADLRKRIAKEDAKQNTISRFEGEPSIAAALEEATEVLAGYIEDPRNHIELGLNEVRFEVEIKGSGKTSYLFQGWIDQLRKLPDGRHELTDLKTGKNRPNSFLLTLDNQLSLYALACVKGRFFRRGEEGSFEIGHLPELISIAHLKDYRKYKKNEFAKVIKDPDKVKIPNPKGKGRDVIREIPNPKYAEGYKLGEQMGQVFYRTQRSEFDLRQAELDLSRVCAAIRRKEFFRRPSAHGSCIGFCRYTQECTAERSEPI
ncbi:MAG: PD-(D/E)XK nuclease family protein [Planctomycetota bacterium]|nr:PD-(D/E)XK nuclease family protein [Planctomycetota bacterium]